jgi:DNA-binding LacI/PurR family transcriptional regulator
MPKSAGTRPSRVTQQDIARIASVSQATVSRVLAGDGRVEPMIRERVVAVMQEHNYQPDVSARSLRQKATNLIGLVVKRPAGKLADEPFIADLIAGIMLHLGGTRYHLCLDIATSALGQAAVYDDMLRTRRVDGLILVESEARDERIRRLQRDQFPFVLIGNPMDDGEIPSVDNDNLHAGYSATKHLVESGFEKIGLLAGPTGLTVSEDRIVGYRMAINEAGAQPRIWHSEFGFVAARQMAELLLESHDRPDALVVLDDHMAMGVVLAARYARIRIPHDLGLVSFNDSSLCNLIDCGLTSLSLNIPQIAASATERLLQAIEGRPIEGPRRMIINTELRARGSSVRIMGAAG